ncbi:hypothetical protein A1Q1_07384 [Trichosporon asahii var. asahii CBS 2479]|uniref:Uncharacterized protein n=1 Tax=Trichosporon asahii var. asahii (strain ATCC 90039 / CBS 2479 / JCM 2466 / KCTC 7840 / NBRC 103889/ NCYC 2677 / UAMH 7654) TaxID=1186058 RepID=J6F7T5_TRIAS|nr:hypothetical protein A1Q1_07384 [Trichosporon asahii var. asahii CBS 2479]EJT51412.1 hypothetical protein A1Q1_07384 [Trichosporon asahii var. asahii CBS 2479]
MKIALLPLLSATLASVASAAAIADPVADWEQRYLSRQDWAHDNSSLKLIGFKRLVCPLLSLSLPQDGRLADVSIEMNEEERSTIDAATRRDPASWAELSLSSSAFWHPDLRELRVYFPVRDALLTHGRSLVEANERGELAERALEGDCRVLGRRATDDVHGVPSNVIRDGLVLLSSPWGHAYKRADNVYVYDFGVRSAHDHHDAHLDARDKKGKVSCYKNHGNKICSFLPGCRQNRCAAPSRSSKSCVDYNGWPDCKGKSKKGFIGSDCQVALAKGKCWNEVIMKKSVNEVASSESSELRYAESADVPVVWREHAKQSSKLLRLHARRRRPESKERDTGTSGCCRERRRREKRGVFLGTPGLRQQTEQDRGALWQVRQQQALPSHGP